MFSLTSGTLLVIAVSTVAKTLLIFSLETCIAVIFNNKRRMDPAIQMMRSIKARIAVNTTVIDRMIRHVSLVAMELLCLNMRGSFMSF
jgi:hypothetical protein